MTRDMRKCQANQVVYSSWCDDNGKVIDDGTITCLGKNHFRITAADPSLRWFLDAGYGMDAEVKDVSSDLGALALQGPKSRDILKKVVKNADLNALKYYWYTKAKVDNFSIEITRTGFTGDLGYELWVAPEHAEKLWDRLMEEGKSYGLAPIGLVALDMVRVEAGMLLIEVDYISTLSARIEAQKSSPFEIGLVWTVDLDGENFIGRKALIEEKKRGSEWAFVGLDIYWPSLEEKFDKVDLPPQVPGQTSRSSVPLFKNGVQIGQATSISFSPFLKKYIALATVESRYAKRGSQVDIEITVEYSRESAKATITKPQFFNPKRKRAVVNG